MCSFFERVSAAAAAATSDSCKGEPELSVSERAVKEAEVLVKLGSAGLGDEAGEEETGEGEGDSLEVEELLTLAVDVPMLCTTIMFNEA